MLAKPLPLLSVFAGGCLSGAALIGFWNAGSVPRTETSRTPTAQARYEPALASAVHASESTARVEPSAREAADTGGESPTEAGSSVADVLLRLEAAYRQALAAVPSDAPSSASRDPGPSGLSSPPAPVAPAPAAPEQTAAITDAQAPEVSAHERVAVVPDLAAPAVAARAQEVAGESVLAARDEARPSAVHVGDVHRNVHVGDVHQGNVHQVQQIAVVQYLQLLTSSPPTPFATPAPTQRRVTKRRAAPFPTSLTNPDNPWGFDFPPTVLVK